MYMKDIEFTASNLASFIKVSKKSVQNWCRDKKLKAIQDPVSGVWRIKGKSVANFLYYYPRYQDNLKCADYYGYRDTIRKIILQDIDSREKLYDSSALASIFDVSTDAVKYWVRNEQITPVDRNKSFGRLIFSEDSIRKFIIEHPRYKGRYEFYKQALM